MTKISVLGQEQNGEKVKKPIEFVYYLNSNNIIPWSAKDLTHPSEWDNVCLITHDLDYDVIAAWANGSTTKNIYLGHWNDGFV